MEKRIVPNKEKKDGFKYTPAAKLKGAFSRRKTKTVEFIDADVGENYYLEVKILWPADIRMLMIKSYGEEGFKEIEKLQGVDKISEEEQAKLLKKIGVETEEEFRELAISHQINICLFALANEDLQDEDWLRNGVSPEVIDTIIKTAVGKDLEVGDKDNVVNTFPEVDPGTGK